MTQEDKNLLLKDLCARLPHGVVYHTNYGANIKLREIDIQHGTINYTDRLEERNIKPYLRPMSSMTEEEEDEYRAINCYEGLFPRNEDALDYSLEHHLDFRGLIPMGLALEAPEDMYKTE